MPKIIAANWKNNPESAQSAAALAGQIAHAYPRLENIVLFPSEKYFEVVAREIKGTLIQLGAQDVSLLNEPTEAASAQRIGWVIVGHSDRRWNLGESDETVNAKLRAVLAAGAVPVVCLGERIHNSQWQTELERQAGATFAGVSTSEMKKCLIVYEPVWAISSTRGAHADTPHGAAEAVKVIRKALGLEDALNHHPPFLYGGSVDAENAKGFLDHLAFAGVLVGRASLDFNQFSKIVSLAESTESAEL